MNTDENSHIDPQLTGSVCDDLETERKSLNCPTEDSRRKDAKGKRLRGLVLGSNPAGTALSVGLTMCVGGILVLFNSQDDNYQKLLPEYYLGIFAFAGVILIVGGICLLAYGLKNVGRKGKE